MATYKIDPSHSEITFKVKHLMITNVTGNFGKFDATMTAEKDDFSDASVSFEAETASISTNNEQRDGHLKAMISLQLNNFQNCFLLLPALRKQEKTVSNLPAILPFGILPKP